MSNFSVRKARSSDAQLLYQWDEMPHVKAATSISGDVGFDMDWEDELDARDDGTEFFIATVNDQAIGALQIIDPATERTHYWGDVEPNQRAIDIWIGEKNFLSRGYGKKMMQFAIEHCFSQPAIHSILIDPLVNNSRSHGFYKRLGFEFLERRQFDDDSDCLVFSLSRKRWQTIAASLKLLNR